MLIFLITPWRLCHGCCICPTVRSTSLLAWCLRCAGGSFVMEGGEELIYRDFYSATRVWFIMISFNIIVGSHALSEHGLICWRINIAGDPCGLYVF